MINAFGNAFLCDFGFSRIRHEITRTFTNIREGGRVRFLAPELLAGAERFRTSTASDVFSLSMTFYSTWARTLPFCESFNEYKVQKHIRKGQRPKRPTTHIGLPAETEQGFWQLIVDMWAHEPSRRPSTDDMQRRLEAIFSLLLGQHGKATFHVPSSTSSGSATARVRTGTVDGTLHVGHREQPEPHARFEVCDQLFYLPPFFGIGLTLAFGV